jgi:diguanylate cyclase (GGDEF)-like protein/PAS domain S-box-containing protein
MNSQSEVGHLNIPHHLDALRFINRIATRAESLDGFLSEVLDQLLGIFSCDRAWLMYPCDPDAPSWRIRMERTRPEWPGGFARQTSFPMTANSQAVQRAALISQSPVKFDTSKMESMTLDETEKSFSIRAQLVMAMHPSVDKSWVLGIHHCARDHAFSAAEVSLFEDIGNRVSDALNHLLVMDKLVQSERYNRMLFDSSPIGLVLGGLDGSVIDCNRAYADIIGRTEDDCCDCHSCTSQGWLSAEQLAQLSLTGALEAYETELPHQNGLPVPVLIRASLVKPGEEQNILFSIEDITERKRIEQALREANARLEALSRHDPLTGLGNRNELEDAWHKVLSRSSRSSRNIALLLMDLNNFKPINDTHGHAVGDKVLQEVAARLRKIVRASDTVVRLGGDEFVVLVDEVDLDVEIEPLKTKIADAISAPIEIAGNRLVVGASIGSAIHPTDAATLNDLLHQADVVMYQNKSRDHASR